MDLLTSANIPLFQRPAELPSGELVRGRASHSGAPWQIRITDKLRARIVQQEPKAPFAASWSRAYRMVRASSTSASSMLARREGFAIHGIRQQVTPHTPHLLRLNSRLQDFRPAWTCYSKILLGGNNHIETLKRSDGFEGRL